MLIYESSLFLNIVKIINNKDMNLKIFFNFLLHLQVFKNKIYLKEKGYYYFYFYCNPCTIFKFNEFNFVPFIINNNKLQVLIDLTFSHFSGGFCKQD